MNAIKVFNEKGAAKETLSLDVTVARRELNSRNFATAVRVLLQNGRQGTVGCKTRGELAFSNKKPWKQKGTGRARVSSIRSPLWRKGGVIFGPQPRVRELSLNKKQGVLALNNLFYGKVDANAICCLDASFDGKPSTRKAYDLLEKASLHDKKIVLFLSVHDFEAQASFRNLQKVRVLFFDQPNAYDLAGTESWAFLKKDAESFKQMVSQWN